MKHNVNISVSVPEGILLSLREENDAFGAQMKKWSALKLCENHKLSVGQGAELADMDEVDFIKYLGQNKVSIFGSAEDIAGDYKNA
jgi:hypothetical protein